MTAEIQAAVKERKGSVQSPKQVIVVDSVPVTALGKPDKKAVRAAVLGGRRPGRRLSVGQNHAGCMRPAKWVRGDHLGLDIPADADALRDGGAAFLTEAFRRAGALGADNAVVDLELAEFRGGSTGRKALLTVSLRTAVRPAG